MGLPGVQTALSLFPEERLSLRAAGQEQADRTRQASFFRCSRSTSLSWENVAFLEVLRLSHGTRSPARGSSSFLPARPPTAGIWLAEQLGLRPRDSQLVTVSGHRCGPPPVLRLDAPPHQAPHGPEPNRRVSERGDPACARARLHAAAPLPPHERGRPPGRVSARAAAALPVLRAAAASFAAWSSACGEARSVEALPAAESEASPWGLRGARCHGDRKPAEESRQAKPRPPSVPKCPDGSGGGASAHAKDGEEAWPRVRGVGRLPFSASGEAAPSPLGGKAKSHSFATAACPAHRVTRARGMVVVTGQNKVTGRPGDAMSSSDAEDDFQEPATPTATQAEHSLPLLPQQFPEVVPLNVGGLHFTTRLSTLRRYEDTMLSAMFSGRHYIPTDTEGRYFIDRDGTFFGDVLNFLRSGDLPPRERVRSVYKEAQYYSIGPLLDSLEDLQPLKGEKVRQAFLGLMPYYKEHLERIVEIAKLRAVQRKARFAKLKVCVFKEEMPITPYECPLFNSLRFERSEGEAKLFEHHCEVDVSFGPWEAVADVYDLLHCIVTDLSSRGIAVDHQCIGVCDKHLINHYYCKRPIYEFKITWW